MLERNCTRFQRPSAKNCKRKKSTTVRFDNDVLDAFKATGKGWQNRMNAALRFVEEGLEVALERKPREPPREVIFDGAFEARLISLACSEVPEGHQRWTVRLLAEKAVELRFAETVSHMTVQRTLKKMNFSLTEKNTGKSRLKATQPL